MMYSKSMIGAAFTGFAIAVLASTSASAVEPDADWSDDAVELYEFMLVNGSEPDVAATVVERYDNGIMPDSVAGASDVVSEASVPVENGEATVSTYADGSVSVAGYQTAPGDFELPGTEGDPIVDPTSGMIGTRAIQGCRTSGGSGYRTFRDCAVSGSNKLIHMGFHADYTLVQGGYDYISKVYSPFQACVGFVCDTPYESKTIKKETSSTLAYSRYYMRYTIANGGSNTARLWLRVGENRTSTKFASGVQ